MKVGESKQKEQIFEKLQKRKELQICLLCQMNVLRSFALRRNGFKGTFKTGLKLYCNLIHLTYYNKKYFNVLQRL
jgi:hypothetical protein